MELKLDEPLKRKPSMWNVEILSTGNNLNCPVCGFCPSPCVVAADLCEDVVELQRPSPPCAVLRSGPLHLRMHVSWATFFWKLYRNSTKKGGRKKHKLNENPATKEKKKPIVRGHAHPYNFCLVRFCSPLSPYMSINTVVQSLETSRLLEGYCEPRKQFGPSKNPQWWLTNLVISKADFASYIAILSLYRASC